MIEVQQKEEELNDIEFRGDLLDLAARCHQLYMCKSYDASEANTFVVEILQDPIGVNEDTDILYIAAWVVNIRNEHSAFFESCLSVYGLALDGKFIHTYKNCVRNGKSVSSAYVGLPIKYTSVVSGNIGKQE